MENDRVNQLVDLLEAVAVELMPTTANNFEKVTTNVLQILCKHLDVMISFCRANDHQAGVTVLLAEWPPRPFVPDPDPLAVVPFEANPIFHMSKDLRASFMLCPGDEGSADYCKMIEAATGIPEVTLIVVPLFADDQPTDGVFGLVRAGNQPFDDYERSMLQTVATLLHQAQSRAKAEARLKQTAFVDSLTGLSNRRALEKQLDTAIADRRDFAIVQIGLENIPSINMLYGRQVGDRMLVEVGNVFQQFCDEHTQVFRVGGNGFALLRCASTSQSEILDTAKMVFNQVTHLVAQEEMFVRPRIKLALQVCVPI